MGEVATAIAERLAGRATPLLVGVNGAQGSGKTTLCRELEAVLRASGRRVATLSIDDLYRTQAERAVLARAVHPLLATRGVPGTHDVALGLAIVADFRAGRALRLPRFDKGADDRGAWEAVGCVDILLFEGWCVGAVPEGDEALAVAVNALEREADGAGVWRRYVNDALAGDYQRLFAGIDVLVMLAAPGFEVVTGWRQQQERELREAGRGGMSDAAVARFVMHYERLTRHMLATLPGRADMVVRLGPDREVLPPSRPS